MTDKLLELGV